jgi:two-component system sensor histidine kinase KdpD
MIVSDDVAMTNASPARIAELLLDVISHDLRAPLTVIVGTASALGDDFDRFDPTIRQTMLGAMQEEAERLTRRIDMLVAVARRGLRRVDSDATTGLPAGTTFSELVGTARAAIGESRLAGRLDIVCDAALPRLNIDQALVAPILTSIIERALDQSPSAAPVMLRVAQADGGIVVEVRGSHRDGTTTLASRRGSTQLNNALFAGALGINGGRLAIASEDGRPVTRLWLPAASAP